jgi:hypothetical protein
MVAGGATTGSPNRRRRAPWQGARIAEAPDGFVSLALRTCRRRCGQCSDGRTGKRDDCWTHDEEMDGDWSGYRSPSLIQMSYQCRGLWFPFQNSLRPVHIYRNIHKPVIVSTSLEV